VTRITLLKYRLQLPGFELPEALRVAQQEFDDRLAGTLDGIANRLEGKASREKDNFDDSFERLEQTIRSCCSEGPQELTTAELQTFLAPSLSIESVTMSLSREI
jgi:multidrug resistance protein MdtO